MLCAASIAIAKVKGVRALVSIPDPARESTGIAVKYMIGSNVVTSKI
jgi:hypothetical protein